MAMTEHELVNRISVLKIDLDILLSELERTLASGVSVITKVTEANDIERIIEKYEQQLKSHSDIR